MTAAVYEYRPATSAVPAPLAQLPNALTVLRLVLVPVFVAVFLAAGDGSSWAAGTIFLVAGLTDQLDGFLARRWRVESRFGKLADPLADRLMIDVAIASELKAEFRSPVVRTPTAEYNAEMIKSGYVVPGISDGSQAFILARNRYVADTAAHRVPEAAQEPEQAALF